AVLLEILLVIFLGTIERLFGQDLGDDRPAITPERFKSCLRRFGFLLLLVVVIEDHRAILAADIRALSVELSWVVRHPEDLEQLIVRDDGRVVFDAHGFGVSGPVSADIFISWVREMSA